MDQEQLLQQWVTTRDLIISTARKALAGENLPALKPGCKLSSWRGRFMPDADGSFVTFYISHKKIKLNIKVKAVYWLDETSVYLYYRNYARPERNKRPDVPTPSEEFTFLLNHPHKYVSFRHDFSPTNGVLNAKALAKGFRFIREIYEDHKTLYISQRVLEFQSVNEKKLLAACMGTHDRLGHNSLIKLLDHDVLALISTHMLALDMWAAGLSQ
jgi:hypothetical protein